MMTLSIVVPVYNEEATIISILELIKAQDIDQVVLEVIVVDDGSRDRSVELLEARPELYAKLVKLPENRGKGAAVKAGLAAATGDFVLFQDADLEYDPEDYQMMVRPIQKFDADVVMGSRMIAPPYTRVFYFWHKVGNQFITLFFNITHNTTFTDVYSCYLLFRRSLVDPDKLHTMGWGQHAEILSKCVRAANSVYEVPIRYHGRTYAEGKKIKAHHTLEVLYTMARERFFPTN